MTPTPRTDALRLWLERLKWKQGQQPIARLMESHAELERELAELTEDVGKCHDVLGECRASDTSELWKFFETHKQLIHRLRCREKELAELTEWREMIDGEVGALREELEQERAQLAANHEATKLMGRWLESERELADRLAGELDGCAELTAAHEALAAWKEARSE